MLRKQINSHKVKGHTGPILPKRECKDNRVKAGLLFKNYS